MKSNQNVSSILVLFSFYKREIQKIENETIATVVKETTVTALIKNHEKAVEKLVYIAKIYTLTNMVYQANEN